MRTFLLATAALLAVAPAAGAQGNESLQKIDTTFAFAKGGLVDLGHVSGDIVVTGWTKGEIKIYAIIERGYLDASLTSSRVSITARSRRNRMGDSRYELSVPLGTEVRASSVSGNVTVRGVAGQVNVNTVSGDVEVRDAADRVEMHSVSGDIRASKLRGRISANSVSGDLTLDDINGALSGKTVSGELAVNGTLTGLEFESVSGGVAFSGDIKGDGLYSVNTHSGDVRLTLPSNIDATLEMQTFSGEVRSAFGITLMPGEQPLGRRNHRMRFSVNGGGPRISLETFSGDINIERGAARASKED
jgi:Putative adhesin